MYDGLCWRVVQCVLQCVVFLGRSLRIAKLGLIFFQSVLKCVEVCRSVLRCVAVCCSVLQCVAVCCSVLQCVSISGVSLRITKSGVCGEVGGWGRVPFSKSLMSPTPRRKWYLTTGRRAH